MIDSTFAYKERIRRILISINRLIDERKVLIMLARYTFDRSFQVKEWDARE